MQPSGQVLWPYRDSGTGQLKSISLAPGELIRRFLQHVLPSGFRRVRLFGWLHPAAKVRHNRVRALLLQAPLLSLAERQTWQLTPSNLPPQSDPIAAVTPVPTCPQCGKPLVHYASWKAGQPPPFPHSPRAP